MSPDILLSTEEIRLVKTIPDLGSLMLVCCMIVDLIYKSSVRGQSGLVIYAFMINFYGREDLSKFNAQTVVNSLPKHHF